MSENKDSKKGRMQPVDSSFGPGYSAPVSSQSKPNISTPDNNNKNDVNVKANTANMKIETFNPEVIATSVDTDKVQKKIKGESRSKLGGFSQGSQANVERKEYDENFANKTSIKTDAASDIDRLNRRPFAGYLAKRFGILWKDLNLLEKRTTGKSFVTHLYSEWGSGKTSFLNLLKQELESNPVDKQHQWTVLEFNAWQNQHIEPSWWSLMESFYLGITNGRGGLVWWKRWVLILREHFWRYITTKYSVGLPIFLMIFVGVLLFYSSGILKEYSIIITALSGAVGFAIKTTGSLLPGNPKSAKVFQELSSDPMTEIKNHFHEIVKFTGRPIMIFIDDLDRCREPYVVSLLESLHTLFNDQRVFYVVAADKKWIASCFHSSYKAIATHIEAKDRPTGHLFIEKLFQISIGLPSMSKEIRRKFVDQMLGIEGIDSDNVLLDEEDEIIRGAKNFSELSELDTTKPEVFNRVLEKTLEDSFDKDIKHRLQKYTDYMDPNPRFIKLLINTYGINVAVAMASGLRLGNEEYEHIAIWTIISLRHPSAAEELADNPNNVGLFLTKKLSNEPSVLSTLNQNEDFSQLLGGVDNGDSELSKKVIRALTGQNPEG